MGFFILELLNLELENKKKGKYKMDQFAQNRHTLEVTKIVKVAIVQVKEDKFIDIYVLQNKDGTEERWNKQQFNEHWNIIEE